MDIVRRLYEVEGEPYQLMLEAAEAIEQLRAQVQMLGKEPVA